MGLMTKLFGSHSEHELKRIKSTVDKIEALRETMQAMSDEELQGQTQKFNRGR